MAGKFYMNTKTLGKSDVGQNSQNVIMSKKPFEVLLNLPKQMSRVLPTLQKRKGRLQSAIEIRLLEI